MGELTCIWDWIHPGADQRRGELEPGKGYIQDGQLGKQNGGYAPRQRRGRERVPEAALGRAGYCGRNQSAEGDYFGCLLTINH